MTFLTKDNLDAALKKESSLESEKKKLEKEKVVLEAKIKEMDAYLEEKNEQVKSVFQRFFRCIHVGSSVRPHNTDVPQQGET